MAQSYDATPRPRSGLGLNELLAAIRCSDGRDLLVVYLAQACIDLLSFVCQLDFFHPVMPHHKESHDVLVMAAFRHADERRK